MNMKIRIALTALVLGLATAGIAGAWGIPSIPSSPISTSSSADPDAFLAKARNAEMLTDRSVDSLYKAVASKEEQEKMEELRKKLNETTDDKEKNAIRHQITESEMATVEKKSKDKQTMEEAKKWDEKKKKHVSDSFYNLTLGSLQAAALVPEGTSIVSSVSGNPASAARLGLKLGAVKDSVSSLGGIVSNTAKVTAGLKPLMSAAKIEAKAPSSASEKPKDASDQI
jgi:hypothetical protein